MRGGAIVHFASGQLVDYAAAENRAGQFLHMGVYSVTESCILEIKTKNPC